jgi:hypothetical protein
VGSEGAAACCCSITHTRKLTCCRSCNNSSPTPPRVLMALDAKLDPSSASKGSCAPRSPCNPPRRTCNVARQAEGQGDPRGQPQAQKRFPTGVKGNSLAQSREVMVACWLRARPPPRMGSIPRRRWVPYRHAVRSREGEARFKAFNGHVIKIQMTRMTNRQAGLDANWPSHLCRVSVAGICACHSSMTVQVLQEK